MDKIGGLMSREKVALVLQGGGALGSYQGGVYQVLEKAGFRPDWIAGISIGAINGAIIAGNPREKIIARLQEFWAMVSSNTSPAPFASDVFPLTASGLAATSTLLYGAPGFFSPR